MYQIWNHFYCDARNSLFLIMERSDQFLRHMCQFYVLLTVHLITVFVNNQLDVHFFYICLFQFSTCFE